MIQDLKQVSNAHLYFSTSFDYPKAIALTEMEKYEDDLTEIVSFMAIWLRRNFRKNVDR